MNENLEKEKAAKTKTTMTSGQGANTTASSANKTFDHQDYGDCFGEYC